MDLPAPLSPAPRIAPFRLAWPDRRSAPLVVASPHSGRAYPDEFVAASRLDSLALRRSEDSFVDELWGDAPLHGAPLIAATFPRAFCDANREPWELDPAMFEDSLPPWVNTTSPRVAAGLGTLARVVSSGEGIYRGRLRFAEAERRVRQFWQPYHAALGDLIGDTVRDFGACLLLDCHSMPGPAGPGASGAGCGRGEACDFVLGDAHGTACAAAVPVLVEKLLRQRGFRVGRNDPYAGGFVTRHYGRPRERVHVLQVEMSRPLYMDEARIEKSDGFAALREALSGVLGQLCTELERRPHLLGR